MKIIWVRKGKHGGSGWQLRVSEKVVTSMDCYALVMWKNYWSQGIRESKIRRIRSGSSDSRNIETEKNRLQFHEDRQGLEHDHESMRPRKGER